MARRRATTICIDNTPTLIDQHHLVFVSSITNRSHSFVTCFIGIHTDDALCCRPPHSFYFSLSSTLYHQSRHHTPCSRSSVIWETSYTHHTLFCIRLFYHHPVVVVARALQPSSHLWTFRPPLSWIPPPSPCHPAPPLKKPKGSRKKAPKLPLLSITPNRHHPSSPVV
ncbi:hypothetical protein BKA70DRAFT_732965 [Coprinopsis sp. MPI-PUGE-AT-0042]|nr:hypothetical protein BKA70DRAFT_732965 [Coprinopsis sp. MPI-PUGE-AT-0042]